MHTNTLSRPSLDTKTYADREPQGDVCRLGCSVEDGRSRVFSENTQYISSYLKNPEVCRNLFNWSACCLDLNHFKSYKNNIANLSICILLRLFKDQQCSLGLEKVAKQINHALVWIGKGCLMCSASQTVIFIPSCHMRMSINVPTNLKFVCCLTIKTKLCHQL